MRSSTELFFDFFREAAESNGVQGLVALVGRFLGSLGRLQDIRGWRYQKLILFGFHLNFFDTKGLAARNLAKTVFFW